jgi:hypothetical protein
MRAPAVRRWPSADQVDGDDPQHQVCGYEQGDQRPAAPRAWPAGGLPQGDQMRPEER